MMDLNRGIPHFVKELDRKLLIRMPWIWETKIHILLFFSLILNLPIIILGHLPEVSVLKAPTFLSLLELTKYLQILAIIVFFIWVFWHKRFGVSPINSIRKGLTITLIYTVGLFALLLNGTIYGLTLQHRVLKLQDQVALSQDIGWLNTWMLFQYENESNFYSKPAHHYIRLESWAKDVLKVKLPEKRIGLIYPDDWDYTLSLLQNDKLYFPTVGLSKDSWSNFWVNKFYKLDLLTKDDDILSNSDIEILRKHFLNVWEVDQQIDESAYEILSDQFKDWQKNQGLEYSIAELKSTKRFERVASFIDTEVVIRYLFLLKSLRKKSVKNRRVEILSFLKKHPAFIPEYIERVELEGYKSLSKLYRLLVFNYPEIEALTNKYKTEKLDIIHACLVENEIFHQGSFFNFKLGESNLDELNFVDEFDELEDGFTGNFEASRIPDYYENKEITHSFFTNGFEYCYSYFNICVYMSKWMVPISWFEKEEGEYSFGSDYISHDFFFMFNIALFFGLIGRFFSGKSIIFTFAFFFFTPLLLYTTGMSIDSDFYYDIFINTCNLIFLPAPFLTPLIWKNISRYSKNHFFKEFLILYPIIFFYLILFGFSFSRLYVLALLLLIISIFIFRFKFYEEPE